MLFVPRHLNGFQFAFTGLFGIVLEIGQVGDVAVQIGIANRERIGIGVLLLKQDSDVLSIVPGQVFRHLDSV